MTSKTLAQPRILTIRQVAATGILTESALRRMEKAGQLPCLYIGRRCLVNLDRLIEQLNSL